MKKRRIAIFQNDLDVGGIQKSLINLLNAIDTSKYDIDLYLFSKKDFYVAHLPKSIRVIYKKPQHPISRFIPFSIYRVLKKNPIKKAYDVSIDFNGYQNIAAVYALKTHATKHVYWVHSDVYTLRDVRLLKTLYLRFLLTPSKWRRFDAVVGVSEGVLERFRKDFPDKPTVAIPNIVDAEDIIKKSKEQVDLEISKTAYNLIMVGRLVYQKGVDLFLNDLKKIIEQRPETHLYILGDGAKRSELENQVVELGLSKNVTFLGGRNNPYKYMAKMDGLVLNSRCEGQGIVLWEAKCLGLQIFFPKRLERFNDGLAGTEDLVNAIVNARRTPKKIDHLASYNAKIKQKIEWMFNEKILWCDCHHYYKQ